MDGNSNESNVSYIFAETSGTAIAVYAFDEDETMEVKVYPDGSPAGYSVLLSREAAAQLADTILQKIAHPTDR